LNGKIEKRDQIKKKKVKNQDYRSKGEIKNKLRLLLFAGK
jgi:hypothetical protein